MERGVIIKGTGGFYDVQTEKGQIVTCRLRGRLRLETDKVMVGDCVFLTEDTGFWVIEGVEDRRNVLVRPPIANIDQVVVVASVSNPRPNLGLLDRILVLAEAKLLDCIVCLSKCDLDLKVAQELAQVYEIIGYPTIMCSTRLAQGIDQLENLLVGKTTTFAGPSGVGKSSILNAIKPGISLAVGEISTKLKQGKHTTRAVQLIPLPRGGLVADTPGFSQLKLEGIEKDELRQLFPEMARLEGECQYRGCVHSKEPKCAVKTEVLQGTIAESRYQNYQLFLSEIEMHKSYS